MKFLKKYISTQFVVIFYEYVYSSAGVWVETYKNRLDTGIISIKNRVGARK